MATQVRGRRRLPGRITETFLKNQRNNKIYRLESFSSSGELTLVSLLAQKLITADDRAVWMALLWE